MLKKKRKAFKFAQTPFEVPTNHHGVQTNKHIDGGPKNNKKMKEKRKFQNRQAMRTHK